MEMVSYESAMADVMPHIEEEEAKMKFLQLKKENEINQAFHSKGKQELDRVKNLPVIMKGYIRFKFPDSYLLQAAFSPKETICSIYAFLKPVYFKL